MSTLLFTKAAAQISLVDRAGSVLAGPFVAYNNVDSTSRGPWPPGTYRYIGHIQHTDMTDPEGAYGDYGILIFDVPGRSGMGVHSGRRDVPDGLGQIGPKHCTMGCIRTTDEALAAFLLAASTDAFENITVVGGAADQRGAAFVQIQNAAKAGKTIPKSRPALAKKNR